MTVATIEQLADINLHTGWSNAWKPINQILGPGVLKIVAAIGVIIVVAAFGKWIWDKRRGGGGNSSALLWSLAIGALLTGPDLLIPLVLWTFDALANTVVSLFKNNGAK